MRVARRSSERPARGPLGGRIGRHLPKPYLPSWDKNQGSAGLPDFRLTTNGSQERQRSREALVPRPDRATISSGLSISRMPDNITVQAQEAVMRKVILAVDPGMPLTVAALTDDGELAIFEKEAVATKEGKKFSNAPEKIAALLYDYSRAYIPTVVIERVAIWPGEDVKTGAEFVGAMWLVIGICAALHIPCHQVTPAVWKRQLGVPGKRAPGAAREVCRMAAAAFPKGKVLFARAMDHNRADAALLGRWWLQAQLIRGEL